MNYDIAPMLHAGKNVLSGDRVEFRNAFCACANQRPIGFLLHGRGDAERIADTDATWEVEPEKGIGVFKPRDSRLLRCGTWRALNGTLFDWNWQDPISVASQLGAARSRLAAVPFARKPMRRTTGNW